MDFRVLLEKIMPSLRFLARKYSSYGIYNIDDLVQEMCLYLWQNYSYGLPIGKNEAYIIKACEFHLLNLLRKGRLPFDLVSFDETSSFGESQSMYSGTYSRNFILNDISESLVMDDLKSIGLSQKEMKVILYIINGFTLREIASEMGISHVMVGKHKKNVIKKLNNKGYYFLK